jgi:hypothetical protein
MLENLRWMPAGANYCGSITATTSGILLRVPKSQPERGENLLEKSRELAKQTQKSRERMIQSELTVAKTFCDLAETEARVGNVKHLRAVVRGANKAFEEIRKQLNQSDFDDKRSERVSRQVEDLKVRLKAAAPQESQ